MADKIRWGILSTAGINRALLAPIRSAQRSELVAVASRDGGRAKAYADAMDVYADRPEELEEAVSRNLFAEREVECEPRQFADYMMACRERLRQMQLDMLAAGEAEFADAATHFIGADA